MNEEELRIKRIKNRYCTEIPLISIQRAKFYTEYWEQHLHSSLPLNIKVASAVKHVFENMEYYIDPDDKIVGTWCETFLGIPIDVERGVFNKVLETETTKFSMFKFRIASLFKSASFLLTKGHLLEFFKNLKTTRRSGKVGLDMDLKTMNERKINPFTINMNDLEFLRNKLLPFWKERSLVHLLEKDLDGSGIYSKNMHDFIKGIPGNTSRQVQMVSTCSTIASIQGHVILDYEKVIKTGLMGMLREVEDKRLSSSSDVLESIKISLEAVILFSEKLCEKMKTEINNTQDLKRKSELEEMHQVCKTTPIYPAKTFKQAVQALWTVKVATEIAMPINLSCFGRLDQLLCPFYEQDLLDGIISEDDAVIFLAELLLKTMSHNMRPETNILSNFYHRFLGSVPITIGGVDEKGEDSTNAVTYLFIKASNLARSVTNISIRINQNTPERIFLDIADSLRAGNSSLSFYNDEINVKAMMKRGFDCHDARNYAVVGCVELTVPGKTGGMSANAILLSRLLDMTLRNGDSKTMLVTVKNEGLKTGNPDSFTNFSQLMEAFIFQAQNTIAKTIKASDLRDKLYADHLPAPYISSFIAGPLDSHKDVTAAGAIYDLTGISMINSIANVVDSLFVIKKLVFDMKKYTLKQIIEAIDANFHGHENLHHEIIKISGKWGNGNLETDQIATQLTTRLFRETYKYRSFKNAHVVPYAISMTSHTIDGRLSIATPDGREAMTPYAASCNPYNVEKYGITNAFRSITAIPFVDSLGCAVNVKFHPSAVGENRASKQKWIALLKTYFELGGSQMQPTVVSKEMLVAAQTKPEEYKDLIIKVGGYSTYFVDLGIDIQNEIISRTEHL